MSKCTMIGIINILDTVYLKNRQHLSSDGRFIRDTIIHIYIKNLVKRDKHLKKEEIHIDIYTWWGLAQNCE